MRGIITGKTCTRKPNPLPEKELFAVFKYTSYFEGKKLLAIFIISEIKKGETKISVSKNFSFIPLKCSFLSMISMIKIKEKLTSAVKWYKLAIIIQNTAIPLRLSNKYVTAYSTIVTATNCLIWFNICIPKKL